MLIGVDMKSIQKRHAMSTETSLEGSEIVIDKEGQWTFNGAPIIREDIVSLLSEHLVQDPDGSFRVVWGNQSCRVTAEDTPFVVWSVTPLEEAGQRVGVVLRLNDGSVELLDPTTLRIGRGNVPYCRVRGGRFRARFSRKAYYQLASMVEETEGGFSLRLGNNKYPLPEESPETPPGAPLRDKRD